MTLGYEDILTAAKAINGALPKTPFNHSRTLSEITGADVFIKFENQQFTASFKDRGALNKLLSLSAAERQRGVVAMSAGNHAQGVAYHAQRLNIPATIVMPKDTPFVKVQHTEGFGANVVLEGQGIDEAGKIAQQIKADEDRTFIHPFDDPLIIAGQGTCSLEMIAEQPELDCLIVPIGGGGLISGAAIAVAGSGREIEVVGVECALYPGVHNALAGKPLPAGGQTIAEGIAVKQPGALTLEIIRQRIARLQLVGEEQIEEAIALYIDVEKSVAEGAGAASLAALLADPDYYRGRTVGLILSGGNIDKRMLASIMMRALIREGRIVHYRIEILDKPGALAAIATIIAEAGGNILEVGHHRMLPDIPAKSAELDVVFECKDADHVARVAQQLADAGFKTRALAGA